MFGAFHPFAAFAGRFDGDVVGHRWQPGRYAALGIEIVARQQSDAWIGPPAGGLDSGLGRIPLGPGQVKARMIIKRHQGESLKIPVPCGRVGNGRDVVGREEVLEVGVCQRAIVKFGESFLRFDSAILEPRASRNGQQANQQGT